MNSLEAKKQAWPYLRLIRTMAQCYQAFERSGADFHKQCGITAPQFDIIATLGNTQGLTCKELGEKTLMTKGTLTGVLDRLEARGLLERTTHQKDARSVIVRLTPDGVDTFEKLYPVKVMAIAEGLKSMTPEDIQDAMKILDRFKTLLQDMVPTKEGDQ